MDKQTFQPKQIDHIQVLQKFLTLYLPAAIIITLGALALFHSNKKAELIRVHSSEKAAVMVASATINEVVHSITSDLAFLANQHAMINSASGKKQAYLDLEQDWLAFALPKGIYDQIRWMDNSGQEKIRVNYNNGEPYIVEKHSLQNKEKRYYFTETIKLNKGEFFISPLDLNIERNQIEQPVKPMIRIGTPIFDKNNQKQGVLLLNYLATRMLDEYSSSMGKQSARAWLLNSNGYWLKGSTPTMEWGFMYNDKSQVMSKKFTSTWQKITAQNNGQFVDKHGLWTFSTLYPLIEGQKTSSETNHGFSPSLPKAQTHDYYWKSVLLMPAEHYEALINKDALLILLVATAIMITYGYSSWLLAASWAAKEKAEYELLEINMSLEQKVKERTQELRHLANHDPLTGLPTRRLCLDRINQAIVSSHRSQKKAAVFFIDLDSFKSVNDTLGHDAGDELLIKVSERMQHCIRETDTIARIGGDEFIVVMADTPNKTAISEIAQKIITAISHPFQLKLGESIIGCSIGIAIYPDNSESPEQLIKLADKAMYKVKDNKKNNYAFFN